MIVKMSEIRKLEKRLDALFPDDDNAHGLDDDVRLALDAVASRDMLTSERRAIVSVCTELILGWEHAEEEQAELDAYVTEMEAEANV